MSGHSKWATIHRKKGLIDAARGKTLFWDFIWLKADLKDIFTSVSFVDGEAISQLPEAIEYKEFESFNNY